MKKSLLFIAKSILSGFLIIAPLYLAVLLILKAVDAVGTLVRPLMRLLPDYLPAERLLSLLLVLFICFLIGLAIRTQSGRAASERIEKSLFERIPAYALFRSLTQQLVADSREKCWKPALAEIEEALVPAFIIEELKDGYTVFVPSVPTPLAGTVYILNRHRVHPVNVPFTQAVQVVARWGLGAKALYSAMDRASEPSDPVARPALR
ncbi:DUF502 domain-containing protein [Steroidobacter cummioxidans]|uniref:DUF502 domain-containing protein n=1 Tax=Steroidobacter cummioxidans TaxID=1803913 RepID=UPI000E31E954|nr:DUF502 domain-containing protein [Steroidobacter cummioxidans]